jgi:uncharacterized protein
MKKIELPIGQRIFAVFLYTVIFVALCYWFSGSWGFMTDSTSKYNLLFVSGALLLVFGSYIAEPFFTKPVDVIANSIAIILALLSVNNRNDFIGYKFLFFSACLLLLFSVLVILLSKFERIEIPQKIFFEILTKAGQSRIVFSFMYLLTIVSYFKQQPIEFTFFLTFWIIVVTQLVIESITVWLAKLYNFIFHHKKYSEILGQAIGCENPFLYKIEVDYFKHKVKDVKKGELVYLSLDNGEGAVGLIINEKQLLNKKWITVYLLEQNRNPLKINFKTNEFITNSNTVFSKDNAVYVFSLSELASEQQKLITENYLYKNKNNFVGYVCEGSNINKMKFHSLINSSDPKYQLLKEGSIIKTKIYDEETLFQIIDGNTDEEQLEKHDVYGYLIGIAKKLGRYNQEAQELEVIKWLPSIYSPVFFDETRTDKSSKLCIGKLPETNLEIIIKDIDSLVTHNTAILGILGIGKSCLTFELIQKVVNDTTTKVVCIDITNEYKKELKQYVNNELLQEELKQSVLDELKNGNKDDKKGTPDDPTSWGNEKDYQKKLKNEFEEFYSSGKRILIINPDWHSVSKAGSQYKIQHKVDLTVSEKTRIISESLFMLARHIWDSKSVENDETQYKAKFLLVFEESHSLIPEWNSTANPGDQSASNGTAKVVLQGRKYGLGSFVVTQRTANISKSILNQCNTIFALRVFDDTGKQFLENYIGSDYSNTLPTLEDRNAIVVGKALKLKQPVIIKLNEKNDIVLKKKQQ